MAETAVPVVMTCIENSCNDVEGVDTSTLTVDAVLAAIGDFEGMYIAKIVEPSFVADQVISESILMERNEFFSKTSAKIEPDTRLMIEISLAGPATSAVAEPARGLISG